MKKSILIVLFLLWGVFSALAQISQSERNQLTADQRSTYDVQQKQINADLKAAQDDLFKAEDIIKMGQEMKGDDAKAAGAAHIARGVALKEKALKAIENAKQNQRLLDQAAREAIRNNKKE